MSHPDDSYTTNLLLGALSPQDLALLKPHLTREKLDREQVLIPAGLTSASVLIWVAVRPCTSSLASREIRIDRASACACSATQTCCNAVCSRPAATPYAGWVFDPHAWHFWLGPGSRRVPWRRQAPLALQASLHAGFGEPGGRPRAEGRYCIGDWSRATAGRNSDFDHERRARVTDDGPSIALRLALVVRRQAPLCGDSVDRTRRAVADQPHSGSSSFLCRSQSGRRFGGAASCD